MSEKVNICHLHMPGAAIVMRDRTTCDIPLTAAYCYNNNNDGQFTIIQQVATKATWIMER